MNNKTKIILSVILYLSTQSIIVATELHGPSKENNSISNIQTTNNENKKKSQSMGFSAGTIGGLGISYRQFLPGKHGFQIGGLAWGDKTDITANIGGQYMYTIDIPLRKLRPNL